MILIQNKLRLMGFIFAFLFFTTLLIGFLNSHIPIPGQRQFSDNSFRKNEVVLKKNTVYRFDCNFTDIGFFIDQHFYNWGIVPNQFSIICDSTRVFKFMYSDKVMNQFPYFPPWKWFWTKEFSVLENKFITPYFIICKDSLLRRFNEKEYLLLVKRRFHIDLSKLNKPISNIK